MHICERYYTILLNVYNNIDLEMLLNSTELKSVHR